MCSIVLITKTKARTSRNEADESKNPKKEKKKKVIIERALCYFIISLISLQRGNNKIKATRYISSLCFLT